MRKYVLAVAMALAMAMGVTTKAQTLQEDVSYVYSLVVWLTNGESAEFKVSTNPEVKYDNGDFVISSTDVNITYASSDVSKFTMNRQEGSGVKQVTATSEVAPGSAVRAYTADGKLISTWKADENGNVDYSLDGLTPGLYIIKTEKTTVKILKK